MQFRGLVSCARCHQLARLRDRRRQRLLAQHMLARFERRFRHRESARRSACRYARHRLLGPRAACVVRAHPLYVKLSAQPAASSSGPTPMAYTRHCPDGVPFDMHAAHEAVAEYRSRASSLRPPRRARLLSDNQIDSEKDAAFVKPLFGRHQAVLMLDGEHVVVAEHAQRRDELPPPPAPCP